MYGIGVRKNKAVPLELPSFSKVNLRDFANRLKATGAQPALCRIQNDETCELGPCHLPRSDARSSAR
ncbi:hypothetical protein ACQP26_09600 [Micromonospora sp. CA-248089]|uniref:hypothetical protein n=1 Tax=Micromonospora sp. CA-248089 TaxID=3239960 RepID=UPI003D929559